MMDNRVFNINGHGKKMLEDVLRLAFHQEGAKECVAWVFDKKAGLVLLWDHEDGSNLFPSPLSVESAVPLVIDWLSSKQAGQMSCEGWDANSDHDGSNKAGWRVYCGDWGHVETWRYSIIAIRPSYLWLGK